MRNLAGSVAVLLGVVVAGSAGAGPVTIGSLNVRQVAVGATYDGDAPCWNSVAGDCELQTLVDLVNPGANITVSGDQQPVGMWSLGGALAASVVLDFKVAGDNDSTAIGLWSAADGDPARISRVELFNTDSRGLEIASATPARLVFDPTTGELTISGGRGVNAGTFTGIDPQAFGFYLDDSRNGNLFYSLDSLNPEQTAQVLAFQNSRTQWWTLGFEDTAYGLGDHDFQDAMIQFTPVPEPGSLLLVGTGLAGLVRALRRRRRA